MSFWDSRKVTVTGGAGFLGKSVQEKLNQRGVTDVFIPRSHDYDLREKQDVDRMLEDGRPDLLIHLAAVVGGIGANRANPGKYFYDNAIMGIHIIEEARKFDIEKTLVVGTICAYPKFTPIPFNEAELWNGYPEETNAAYGLAKKMLLVQAQAYREQYDMNVIYLMPVNLYGPRDNFDLESSHVIAALIRKYIEARDSDAPTVTAWGTGSATREFLYVDDAAEGILMAMEHYNGSDPVNVGSSEEISIRDLSEMISDLVGYDGETVWDPKRPDGQPRRKLDTTKAFEEFGYSSQMPFVEGLKKTIQWYEENMAAPANVG